MWGGAAVALLYSLESVLIKKDWVYSVCPKGNLLHCKHVLKQGSHERNEVWSDTVEYSFLYRLLRKTSVHHEKVLDVRVVAEPLHSAGLHRSKAKDPR